MICLAYGQSGMMWTATMVLYTCIIWIPYVEMKRSVVKIVGFMMLFYPYLLHEPVLLDEETDQTTSQKGGNVDHHQHQHQHLPVVKFEDLECYLMISRGGSSSSSSSSEEEEHELLCCSVCLVEFEREDLVIQLPRCGHVFHTTCIHTWLHHHPNHFTCPLCRSLVLQ